jgi:hypothetical protein
VPVRPRRISEFKPILGNLAQSSHYLVQFGSLPIDGKLSSYLFSKGIDSRFIAENAGLLCYSASLPTSSLGTFTTDGNHMGVRENFAHSRVYTAISLDFYIDRDYKMLNFLEGWMEYISSGNRSIGQNSNSYFVRMQYPRSYKIDTVKIFKFDRDKREIEYNFRGFFPENISSVQVSYTNSEVLKVSASFLYDRYIAGKSNSVNEFLTRDNNNLNPLLQPNPLSSRDSQLSAEELLAITRQRQSVIFSSPTSNPTNLPLSRQANPSVVISERRTV